MKKVMMFLFLIIFISCSNLKELKNDSQAYNSEGFVNIRNEKQFIKIVTENINNPILLYLHGGPGGAETPKAFNKLRVLQKDFTLVFWEQRGAGKTFDGFIASKYQSINSFVEDTKTISDYLLKKFNKEKILLVGNSWGALLGVETVKKYPEIYYAFIGTGQVVDMDINYQISYDLMLENAIKTNDLELINDLNELSRNKIYIKENGKPSGTTLKYYSIIKKQEDKIEKIKKIEELEEKYEKPTIFKNKIAYNRVSKLFKMGFLYDKLWIDIKDENLRETTKTMNLPIYLVSGPNDWHTPYPLVKEWFELLEAPKKELIWFENSGHSPELDSPKQFTEMLLKIKNDIKIK